MTPSALGPASYDVVIVGLGAVARTHLAVLEQCERFTVVAGVDPNPPNDLVFSGAPLPVYRSIEAVPHKLSPSLVVVATPTPTHADVYDAVTARFPAADVLMEKPAADNLTDALRLLSSAKGRRAVTVTYHLAFSAEVLWATNLVATNTEDLGSPTRFESLFADPYARRLDQAQTSYGTSWLDSGINALSIIERFATVDALHSLQGRATR